MASENNSAAAAAPVAATTAAATAGAAESAPAESTCRVVVVPALEDNYMYLLIDTATCLAAVVDPVDPEAIRAAADKEGATIKCILTTHNHWDHSGGNLKLLEQCAGTITDCYGGVGDNVPGCTQEVGDGSVFQVGETEIRVLFTPCHTVGHVCYVADGRHVFTGDTMFVSGCGNFNTGTPQQMVEAFDKILALPDETQVWVGHEYTAKNCAFACYCEPDNTAAAERLAWAQQQTSVHKGGRGTVPTTIGREKAANPFARIDALEVMEFCQRCPDRVERMRLVRKGKDDWGRGLRK